MSMVPLTSHYFECLYCLQQCIMLVRKYNLIAFCNVTYTTHNPNSLILHLEPYIDTPHEDSYWFGLVRFGYSALLLLP